MKRRNVIIVSAFAAVAVFVGGASVGAESFQQSQEDSTVIGNDINRIVGYNDQLHSAFESIKNDLASADTKIADLTSNNQQLTTQLNQSNDELHDLRLKADNQSLPHVIQNLPQPGEMPAKTDASSTAASSSSASN